MLGACMPSPRQPVPVLASSQSSVVASATAPESCEPPPSVETITVDEPVPGEFHVVFELDGKDRWLAAAPPSAARSAYEAKVVDRLGHPADPRGLLERQRQVYARSAAPGDVEVQTMDRALANVGRVGPVSCLDWMLWRAEDARFSMVEHPTELSAFVLRRGNRLRIYLSGADRLGQKLRSAVSDRVAADVALGWELAAHLHNHPFLFDRRVGDRAFTTSRNVDDVGGALCPSTNDLAAYESMSGRLGLGEAWITNGLSTARYGVADRARLHAEPKPEPAP